MNQRSIAIRELKKNGFVLKRNGSNHDIYFNAEKKCAIPLKRGHFDEDDLRYIRKEIEEINHRDEEK